MTGIMICFLISASLLSYTFENETAIFEESKKPTSQNDPSVNKKVNFKRDIPFCSMNRCLKIVLFRSSELSFFVKGKTQHIKTLLFWLKSSVVFFLLNKKKGHVGIGSYHPCGPSPKQSKTDLYIFITYPDILFLGSCYASVVCSVWSGVLQKNKKNKC